MWNWLRGTPLVCSNMTERSVELSTRISWALTSASHCSDFTVRTLKGSPGLILSAVKLACTTLTPSTDGLDFEAHSLAVFGGGGFEPLITCVMSMQAAAK